MVDIHELCPKHWCCSHKSATSKTNCSKKEWTSDLTHVHGCLHVDLHQINMQLTNFQQTITFFQNGSSASCMFCACSMMISTWFCLRQMRHVLKIDHLVSHQRNSQFLEAIHWIQHMLIVGSPVHRYACQQMLRNKFLNFCTHLHCVLAGFVNIMCWRCMIWIITLPVLQTRSVSFHFCFSLFPTWPCSIFVTCKHFLLVLKMVTSV